jgi:hypothetical protein
MVRPPSKILTFKRLTRGTRAATWHLDSNINKKSRWIFRKIRSTGIGQSERAYLYVAMATCLEADIKHRTKLALEIRHNDIELFKKLYGEAKLDLDLLFHVIDESISLGDLLLEVTNISDGRGLVAKCEILLNALSGSKRSLLEHFKKADAAKQKTDPLKPFYAIMLSYYDSLVPELENIFQIRHAVVHDVFNEGGPVGWAVRRNRLQQTFSIYMNFLVVWQDTFWHAINEGLHPRKHKWLDHKKIRKEVRAREMSLIRRQPHARSYVQKLDNSLAGLVRAICDVVGVIEGKRKPNADQIWPSDIATTFFKFAAKLATQLDLYSLDEVASRKERIAVRRAKSAPAAHHNPRQHAH